MATEYFDNVVIADTLTVVGQTSTSETIGTLTVTTSLLSAAGKIGLGTTPGTAGGLNIDAAAYSNIPIRLVNSGGSIDVRATVGASTFSFGTTSATAWNLSAGAETKWTIGGSIGTTSALTSGQAIAQIVGGATSTTLYQSNGSTVAYQYLAAGAVGIGGAANARFGVYLQNTATASAGSAMALRSDQTVVAAANSDGLYGIYINPTYTVASFTGLQAFGLHVAAFSTASWTSPGNPIGLSVGVITGTGASVATALQLAPPTGASTNYLIAHTTPATFNVTAAGLLTTAESIVAGAAKVIGWTAGSFLGSPSDGVIRLSNNAVTDFSRLQFGGTTSSFPSLKRNGTALDFRFADDSGYCSIFAAGMQSPHPTAGVGYSTGAGGAQTQATDKSTGVTSNTITTAITMNAANLAAATIVSFTFTNSSIAATDTVVVTHQSGGTSGAYTFNAFPAAGSAVISVRNNTAGGLAEAIVLRVTVIKSVSA